MNHKFAYRKNIIDLKCFCFNDNYVITSHTFIIPWVKLKTVNRNLQHFQHNHFAKD